MAEPPTSAASPSPVHPPSPAPVPPGQQTAAAPPTATVLASWLRLVGGYGLLLVLGPVVGLAGAFIQGIVVHTRVPLPVGLVLALAGTGALFVAGAVATRSRVGAILPAVAWLLAVLAVSSERPEGDVILPQQTTAYVYLFGGALLGAVIATATGARPAPPVGR